MRLLARFRRDRSGATAVEFALIALPFFGLIFAIIQTSIVMFASQALQTMTSDASRKIMTGQLSGTSTLKAFRDELCDQEEDVIFDCSKILVQVKSFDNFALANPKNVFTPDCFDLKKAAGASCYSPGGPQKVVLVRVVYPWPFGLTLEDLGRPRTLVAVSAIRTEPY